MLLMPANSRRFWCFTPASPILLPTCVFAVGYLPCEDVLTSVSLFHFAVIGPLYSVLLSEPNSGLQPTCNPSLFHFQQCPSFYGSSNNFSTRLTQSKGTSLISTIVCLYPSSWPIPSLKMMLRSQLLLNSCRWSLRRLNAAHMLHAVALC